MRCPTRATGRCTPGSNLRLPVPGHGDREIHIPGEPGLGPDGDGEPANHGDRRDLVR